MVGFETRPYNAIASRIALAIRIGRIASVTFVARAGHIDAFRSCRCRGRFQTFPRSTDTDRTGIADFAERTGA